jgi:hypothetical protein
LVVDVNGLLRGNRDSDEGGDWPRGVHPAARVVGTPI